MCKALYIEGLQIGVPGPRDGGQLPQSSSMAPGSPVILMGVVWEPFGRLPTQSFQKASIKEYTLHQILDPLVISAIFLN